MIFIGLFVDLIDHIGIINTPDSIFGRVLMLLSAIIIMGFATYFYLRVELGAGPRDGLMEGLVRKLNKPVWLIRGMIEITVLVIGFFMGGPVGIGTLLLAFLMGLLCSLPLKLDITIPKRPTTPIYWIILRGTPAMGIGVFSMQWYARTDQGDSPPARSGRQVE